MRRRRIPSLLLRVALVLFGAALLLELAARAVVFGWVPAPRLRAPGNFAAPGEDEFWTLKRYLEPAGTGFPTEPPRPDPQLGWLNRWIDPVTYDHRVHTTLAGRRPVLLFGDSFAHCLTPEDECFQGLLERSELGARYALANYGVGGYGVDQTYLLMRRALDLWDEPVVIFSLYLDGDLDRAGLEFREWPKPRLRIRAGELTPERERLPGGAEYMQREFPPRTSWAWRLLVHSDLLPESWRERIGLRRRREQRVRAVCALILEEAARELHRRELPFLFVLFHSRQSSSAPEILDWREGAVVELLTRLEVPYLLAGPALVADSKDSGLTIGDYFLQQGRGRGHLNARGNEVVHDGMMALVSQLAPGSNRRPPLDARRIAHTVLRGRVAAAGYEEGVRPPLEDPRRLYLRVGGGGPTEVHYDLERSARSFEAAAWIPPGGDRALGSVDLAVIADGQVLLELPVRGGEALRPFEVDLTGRRSLVLRAGDAGDGITGDLLVLGSPRFR